ncbi:MAG TPA: substrate-binding domain-containing protein [Acidobacteriota bacterium]|nr:substrate-binding domain-containing protein [Acidobacteriota bacterium]
MGRSFRVSALAGVCLLVWGCAEEARQVTICHTSDLRAFVESAGERFQSNHPRVSVRSESADSLEELRDLIRSKEYCDLVASSDYRLIERFLKPEQILRGTVFLGDEMVLATSQRALWETEEGRRRWQAEWTRLIFSQDLSYAVSDPNRDPTGYFGHLTWKLSEIHYRNPGLYRRFLNGRQESPAGSGWAGLTSSLASGGLDFAFLYRSMAERNGLEYLSLPGPVSLGESAQADRYRQVFWESGEDSGQAPFKIYGAPIRYGMCAVGTPRREADLLLEYLLSPEAADMARRLGYTVVPARNIGNR